MAALEHCNIRTADLVETVRFYSEVVGLEAGAFPGKSGQGAWLYDEAGVAVIHVTALDLADTDGTMERLRDRLGELAAYVDIGSRGTGVIDHIAFRCEDFPSMVKRLQSAGLYHRVRQLPQLGLVQILVNDPNGITLELNFRRES
jgi:catechol 2,3-dioxygenase-like lactoylglutathione lyase family enzyme